MSLPPRLILALLASTLSAGCDDPERASEELDDMDAETDTDSSDGSDSSDSSDTSDTDTEDTTDEADTTDTDTTDAGPEPLSFALDVYPIILASCGCHVSNSPGSLAMPNASTAYANLVGVPSIQVGLDRVDSGNPDASHVFKKITGTQSFGNPMPSSEPLAAEDIAVFELWIATGALE